MMLLATAVMKAWTPPVKIPITFPWAACVCMFTAVALEMDPGNRIFTTLPVVPVPEMPDQE